MKIQDLIVKTEKVKWQDLKDLQPENLKIPYHNEKIKKSIIKNGFAQAIYVWQDPETQELYICDGHLRHSLLIELINGGAEVPDELSCTFLDNTVIKTKKDAVKILLEVFNVKKNPMDADPLKNLLEDVDLSVDDVAFDDLDLKFEVEDFNVINNEPVEQQANSSVEKNKEIDIDNLDTQECKIVFKFDAVMYESVLQRLNTIKQEDGHATNEAVLLSLLENYGA